MKKIYSLKSKINNNSEFIFYDGKKVEKDFKLGIKDSKRGAIDYGRLIIPELLNDINKVISIDIGDILVEKDLNDLYELNIEHYGYLGVIDPYPKCFSKSIFNHKENYVNGGVILLNVEKWKELNLYQYIVKMFKYVLTQTKFYDPYSDIMNDFLPWGSTGFMPLKYNHPDYIIINETNQKEYKIWIKNCSYYHNKRDIVIEAENNVVIRNLNNFKVYKGKGTKKMKLEWNYYAKLTGFYKEICKKYKKYIC
jgi:lipopolysaccharide biosynthesis glycosyltransferase